MSDPNVTDVLDGVERHLEHVADAVRGQTIPADVSLSTELHGLAEGRDLLQALAPTIEDAALAARVRLVAVHIDETIQRLVMASEPL